MQRLLRVAGRWAAIPRWTVLAGVVGVLVLFATLLLVIVYLPELTIDPRGLSRTDWLTHVESLRTTILQGLGGSVLLGTLYLTARTLWLNRRGQLTERFTKAIDQLGELEREKLPVRLGGIFALEQIALDSVELHWPVLEVLTAFLRNLPPGDEQPRVLPWLDREPWHERDRAPARAEVQAVLEVLGRRSEKRRRWERLNERALNLRFADLARVHLAEAHLEDVLLTGARLDDAHLGQVHLERAYMAGTYLRRAFLRGAHLAAAYLASANLEHANLRDADLTGADLTHARLHGANLRGATVTGQQLQEAEFDIKTTLPVHLRDLALGPDPDRR